MQRNHRQHPNLAKHWPGGGPWCELELSPGTVGFFLRPGHRCEAAGGITTSPSPQRLSCLPVSSCYVLFLPHNWGPSSDEGILPQMSLGGSSVLMSTPGCTCPRAPQAEGPTDPGDWTGAVSAVAQCSAQARPLRCQHQVPTWGAEQASLP